jgi:hypothetical protein
MRRPGSAWTAANRDAIYLSNFDRRVDSVTAPEDARLARKARTVTDRVLLSFPVTIIFLYGPIPTWPPCEAKEINSEK